MKAAMISAAALLVFTPAISICQISGYFGKTTVHPGPLDINVISSRALVPAVSVENRSSQPARCEATFSNGAQFAETRRAYVGPGKRVTLAYPVHYRTAKVDIDVNCAPRATG